MGIDIDWKMIQGATYHEWEQALEGHPDLEEFDNDVGEFLVSGLDLYRISPWYDADSDDCVYGVLIESGDGPTDIHLPGAVLRAEEAEKELKEKYGISTTTIVSQNVW